MATISSLGIGSGLDVNSIVSQLMETEKQPLTTVQTQISNFNSQISSLGRIKSDMATLQTAVDALKDSDAFNVYKATASDASIFSASADATASAGTYAITVNQLATAQTVSMREASDGNETTITDKTADLATAAGSLTFSFAGKADVTVDIANGASLEEIRTAINQKDLGFSATIVNTGSSAAAKYKLVLTSTDTGAATEITKIAGGDAMGLGFLDYNTGGATAMAQKVAAQDASLTINGVTISASGNAVSDAVSGISLTLTKQGSSTLTVASNSEAINKKVQTFVDAYNKVKLDADNYRAAGSLKGDSTLLSLKNQLSSVLQTLPDSYSQSGNTYQYLSEIGISIQKNGDLAFDSAAFTSALAKNPSNVKGLFSNTSSDGFMDRFDTRITGLLDTEGLLGNREKGIKDRLKISEDKQEQIQYRLEKREATLRAQFTAMDTAIAQMQASASYISKIVSSS